jgi:ankyrin repeat protein
MIMEHLAYSIGLFKALRLRVVNKTFNHAILYTVSSYQFLKHSLHNLHYECYTDIPPFIQARVFLSGSYTVTKRGKRIYLAIENASTRLAELMGASNDQAEKNREMIALAAAQSGHHLRGSPSNPWKDESATGEKTRRQNLICGAIIIRNLPLMISLLQEFSDFHSCVGVNKKSAYFGRPLHIAAAWGYIEIVQYLLDNGADAYRIVAPTVNDNDWNRRIEHVCLWSRRVDQSPDGSPLRAAALSGHEDIVRLLLQPKYNIWSFSRPEYYRAILAATRSGHENILDMLLNAAGLDFDKIGSFKQQILFEAVRHDRENIVLRLLQAGTDVNFSRGWDLPRRKIQTALHIAAAHNRTGIIRLLLKFGANIGEKYEDRDSVFLPIDTAARFGHLDAVSILLEHGSSPTHAFGAAIYGSQIHLLRYLLDQGIVNLNMPFHDSGRCRVTVGREAMSQAILSCNPTIVKFLIAEGISVALEPGESYHSNLYSRYPRVVSFMKEFVLGLTGGREPVYRYWNHDPYASIHRNGVFLSKDTWEWVGKY